jgi:hypothetical protein
MRRDAETQSFGNNHVVQATMCEAAAGEYARCSLANDGDTVLDLAFVAGFSAYAGAGYSNLSDGDAKARWNYRNARHLAGSVLRQGANGDAKTFAQAALIAANDFFAQNGGE